MPEAALSWPLLGAVFLAAGFVKGISGMGLPTLAMALLGLAMAPAEAAALMALPALATNVAQCIGPHARALARRLWPLWLTLALATIASPLPDLHSAGAFARLALGGVLLLYGAWGWLHPALPHIAPRAEPWAAALAGLATGCVAAATGVFVLPMVPLLQALRLDKEEMVQALGLSFGVATLALMARLHGGLPGGAPWGAVLVAVTTAFAGMGAGTVLRRRWPPRVFQRALYSVCLGTGAVLVARAL